MSAGGGNRGSKSSKKTNVLRFGEMARRLGFVSDEALSDALRRQKARVENGESHKLLGLILLELGHIDNQQLIAILREFEGEARRAAAV